MTEYDPVTYWRARGLTYGSRFRYTAAFVEQERLLRSVIEGLEFDSVLEVGCGFGRIGRIVTDIRPSATYTGIDLSPDQLRRARVNVPGGTFHETTLADFIDTSPGQFDLVLAVEFLMHQPTSEVRAAVRALKKLARRDLVTLDWEAPGETAGNYCFGHDYAALIRGAERISTGRQALWHKSFAS